ncbi:hypothetical protein AcV7_005531 [Taiwanofungus camphoratus]|nr:hypothetical protein AcV7_005531 [Antrodia cinnamomea]
MNPSFVPTLHVEVFGDLKTGRHLKRRSREEKYILFPGQGFEVEDGDILEVISGIPVTIRWQKVCCCYPPSRGISVVYSPLPDVTHHVTPTYVLSPDIATSLVNLAHLVKPSWLEEISRLADPTLGSASLEHTFALPLESKHRPAFSSSLPVALKAFAKWERNEARVGIFRGYRFIFVVEGGREVQETMRELVRRGEGDYECFPVEGGRSAWHKVLAKGKGKGSTLVLIANEEAMTIAVGKDHWRDLVDEAGSFGLLPLPFEKVIESVVLTDVSYINPSPVEHDDAHGFSSPLPDVVPNTHPDEPSIPPELPEPEPVPESVAPRRRLPRRATSRASSRAPSPSPLPLVSVQESEESEPSKPRRALVRRAGRSKAPIVGIDDLSADLEGDSVIVSSTATPEPEPGKPARSTDMTAPTLARSSRLKRRAGTTQTPVNQLFALTNDVSPTEIDEPPLKKFKALFEESDPDRIAELGASSSNGTGTLGHVASESQTLTQNQSSSTQVQPRLRADGVTQLAPLPEEEEESMTTSVPGTSIDKQIQGTKRKSQAVDEDVQMEDRTEPRAKKRAVENVNAVEKSTSQAGTSRTASKPSSKTSKQAELQKKLVKSGAAPGRPDTDEAFLKAVASTKRGKKTEDTFDREFNNLKISKPDLEKDQERKEWAVLDDFGDDGDVRGNFMVILEMDVPVRKNETQALDRGGGRLDWEGRPDFKKFKKKSVGETRHVVQLYVDEKNDYGVGSQYWKDSPQMQPSSQPQSHLPGTRHDPSQTAPSRSQTQRKGRSRTVVVDSEEDNSDFPESAEVKTVQSRASTQTVRARTERTRLREKSQPLFMDSEEDEQKDSGKQMLPDDDMLNANIDEDFDDDFTLRSSRPKTHSSATRQSSRIATSRKLPLGAIIDDDSDDEATFKGFGAKRKGKRR